MKTTLEKITETYIKEWKIEVNRITEPLDPSKEKLISPFEYKCIPARCLNELKNYVKEYNENHENDRIRLEIYK